MWPEPLFQRIEDWKLARKHHASCFGKVHPACLIAFGEALKPAAPWRPFHFEFHALDDARVKFAFGREDLDDLSARLANPAKVKGIPESGSPSSSSNSRTAASAGVSSAPTPPLGIIQAPASLPCQ
jgi:hypothetical protein